LFTGHIVGKIRCPPHPDRDGGATRRRASLGIVSPMTGGDDPGPHDGPDDPTSRGDRMWQHPSEVGLATRGRADRRRSTLVASGVVLGGLGLLVTGVALGGMKESTVTTMSTLPVERAELSVATVSVTDGTDGSTGTVTGVVVDGEGHLIVHSAALGDAESVWAKCGDGDLQPATVLGTDTDTDLTLLQLEDPSGVPVSVSTTLPRAGTELRLFGAQGGLDTAIPAVAGEPPPRSTGQLLNLVSASSPTHFVAALAAEGSSAATAQGGDLAGSMAFDPAGRLLGIVAGDGGPSPDDGAVHVLAALEVLDAAERLIATKG
jgi:hypothetical protein